MHLAISAPLRAAVERRPLLRHELPVPAVHPRLAANGCCPTTRSVDYASALGKTTSLPPYLNYFAGGPDSVRGYRESRLGPRDNIGIGNPFGGNFRVVNRCELIIPGAGQVEKRRPGQLVLRHGQRVPDRQ